MIEPSGCRPITQSNKLHRSTVVGTCTGSTHRACQSEACNSPVSNRPPLHSLGSSPSEDHVLTRQS